MLCIFFIGFFNLDYNITFLAGKLAVIDSWFIPYTDLYNCQLDLIHSVHWYTLWSVIFIIAT